jgi:hypothetical protein
MTPAWCWRKWGVRIGPLLDEHDFELHAATRLVPELPLTGAIITADALYCLRLCAQITAAGGNYPVVVKGNQPHLQQDLMLQFEAPPHETTFGFVEQRHRHGDRLDMRRVWTSGELFGYLNWPGARQVVKIERVVQQKRRVRSQVRYFITNLPAPDRTGASWVPDLGSCCG